MSFEKVSCNAMWMELKMLQSRLRSFNQEHIYLLSIVALSAFIRLWKLNMIPIFYDEGAWCYWALKILQSKYSLSNISWIYVTISVSKKPSFSAFLYSLSFHIFGINLFAARFISAISGIFTVIILWKLAKELYGGTSGLLASFFLSISVFHVWYSRLALHEALLTLLVTTSILAYYKGIKLGNIFFFLLGGLCVGLAINTKQNGVIGLIVIVLYLIANSKYRYVFTTKAFWISILIAVTIHSPFLYWAFNHNFDIYRSPGSIDIDLINLFSAYQIYLRASYLASWIKDFLGWPMLILMLLIIPTVWFRRKEDDILLIIWMLMLLSFWPAVKFYPRYLMPAVPSIYIASSRVVTTLFSELRNLRVTKQRQIIIKGLFLLFVFIAIVDTSVYLFGTLTQPSKEERLPNDVKYQFIESSFSGYGLEEAVQFLKENNYPQDTVIVALPYFKWSIAFLTKDYYPAVYHIELIDGYFANDEKSKSIIVDNVCVFIIKNFIEEYDLYGYHRIYEIPNIHLEKIIYVDGSPEVHIFLKYK